jgi:hypothetical protein
MLIVRIAYPPITQEQLDSGFLSLHYFGASSLPTNAPTNASVIRF